MQPAEVVLRFLESIGRSSEAEFYLDLFRKESRERFALIAVDRAVMRDAAPAVELDLHFLASLGLAPGVVVGHVDPAGARSHAEDLQSRLGGAGVAAAVLAASMPDLARAAASAAQGGALPIVVFEDRAAGVDMRFDALGELAAALATRKLVFLGRRGGFRARGERLSVVNLATDAATLLAPGALAQKPAALLRQAQRLLERSAHSMTVSVTSPLLLLRELFTVKGAGTLIRRGSSVERAAGYGQLDVGRLRALLGSSFGRAPNERFFDRPASRIYLVQGGASYRGAAIVKDTPLGAYLTKFAVERAAQGEGIGRDLWREVTAEHPALFWRARAGNPISSWYAQQCDGFVRCRGWTVYWKGIPVAAVPAAVDYALTAPIDFS